MEAHNGVFIGVLATRMRVRFLVAIPVLFVVTLIGAGIATLLGNYESLFFLLFVLLVDVPILINAVTQLRKKRRLLLMPKLQEFLGETSF